MYRTEDDDLAITVVFVMLSNRLFGLGWNLCVELVLLDDIDFARFLGHARGRVRLLAALIPIRARPQLHRLLTRLVVLQLALDDDCVIIVGMSVDGALETWIKAEERTMGPCCHIPPDIGDLDASLGIYTSRASVAEDIVAGGIGDRCSAVGGGKDVLSCACEPVVNANVARATTASDGNLMMFLLCSVR